MTIAAPLAAALVTFVAVLFVGSRRRTSWLAHRIGAAPRVTRIVEAPAGHGVRSAARRLSAAVDARFSGTRGWRATDRLVERAALTITTADLVTGAAGGALVLAAVVVALGGTPLFGLALAAAALAAGRIVLGARAARRIRAFEGQLPEVLGTIAGALRAGHSFLQALQTVVEGCAQPVQGELERVLNEIRLGRAVDDALADLGARIGSRELDFVVDAVVIQRQVGGSLAGIVDIVADSLRQRQQFVLRIRALTAMGRTSANVLTVLPVVIALLLTLLNRSYMHPLFATASGRVLLIPAALLMATGAASLRRMARLQA